MSATILTPTLSRLGLAIIKAGAMTIRDVDGGEEPFLYSSGNKGPGYVMIKGLVSWTSLRDALVAHLAYLIANAVPSLDFVAANVTGGVPPGILLGQQLTTLLARDVPVVYVRDTRKRGGHREHVTGLSDQHPILGQRGACGVVVEELVNYASTTCNSTHLLRELGFQISDAACIVSYDTAPCHEALREANVQLHHLMTIENLICIAEEHELFSQRAIDSYREFLADPSAWMAARNITRDEQGGTK